jgi:hypothetical protein
LDFIDSADASIASSTGKIQVQKKFKPSTTAQNTYTITFNRALFHPSAGYVSAVSSTSFTLEGETCFFDDDGYGNLRVYYVSQGSKNFVRTSIGTVDYVNGIIKINSFLPSAIGNGGEIDLRVEIEEYNVSPVRNQILLIAGSKITLINDNTGTIDARLETVSTLGNITSLNSSSIAQLTAY